MKTGSDPTAGKRVVGVVGGGITGLTAAYCLYQAAQQQNLPLELKLLEATDCVGGLIQTTTENGFVMERGPDAFITTKPWAFQLCQDLGIADQLISPNPNFPRSFIVRAGKLYPVPEGFYLMAPTALWPFVITPIFSWRGKLRMAMDLFLPPSVQDADESLEDFVVRRLGREAFERMAQPMIGGIYSANPKELSLKATMPQFLQLEQRFGSIIRALVETTSARRAGGARYNIFRTFPTGMRALVDRLVQTLPLSSVQTKATVIGLRRQQGEEENQTLPKWEIHFDDGQSLVVDAVCMTLPAVQTAKLLTSFVPEVAKLLKTIPYTSSATINLAFERSQIGHRLDGMGFVVPAIENQSITACTFSSLKFPHRAPEGKVLLRAFAGGALQQDLLERSDPDLLESVLSDLCQLLQIEGIPIFSRITRWTASPQYHLGHLDRISQIETEVSKIHGLELAGNAFHGVGVPDCVRSANQAAGAILQYLFSLPLTR
jgi:oxygen-dependent protoporphyrinogen oxidase